MVRSDRAGDSGIALLEVMVALVILVLGFLALAQVILTGNSLRRTTDERKTIHAAFDLVQNELRLISEEARADRPTWAQQIVAAVAAGGDLGPTFDVPGLARVGATTPVGSITLVTDERLTDADVGARLGLPRDLDADGLLDNPDVSATALLLPVVVTLRWRGLRGNREIRRAMFISAY